MSYDLAGLKIEAGSKKHGFLVVGETATDEVKIPLMVVNGSSPGPTLCLVAGTHATEYAGIVAATEMYCNSDPKSLSGRLIIIPVLNMPSFQDRIPYVCKIDNLNLSTVFPGDKTGTMSYLIAYETYEKVFKKANYIIDLHGGEIGEEMMSITIFAKTGDEKIDAQCETMAKAFPTKYVLVSSNHRKAKSKYGSLTDVACLNGIPSIVSEAGHSGRLKREDVDFHVKGITNVMKILKMVEGHPEKYEEQRSLERFDVKAKRGGIFHAQVRMGDRIKEGEFLGEIKNVFGETLEKVYSPGNGVVYLFKYCPVVNSGDRLYGLGLF